MKLIPNDIFFSCVEESLNEAGTVRFKVKGVSMQPLLRNNRDEVSLVKYKADGSAGKGDIVLFKFNGRHILHRIRKQKDGIYVLRGDNAVNNEYCRDEDIMGVVDGIFRQDRKGTFRLILPGNWPYWHITSLIPRLRNCIGTIKKFFQNSF